MIVQKWLSLRRLRREQDALSFFEGRRAAQQSHINFTKLWDTKPATVIAFAKAKAAVQFLITLVQTGGTQCPLSTERIYGPDTLKIITAAFDDAHKCLPAKLRENDRARRKLALLIIRHLERGERNPECLADSAVLDFLHSTIAFHFQNPVRGMPSRRGQMCAEPTILEHKCEVPSACNADTKRKFRMGSR
ncbi:MAG: hypothetical protein WA322_16690 [Pseudolabrys sp.]